MKKLTLKEFVDKATEKHKGKYDYNKVVYTNNSTKVCIICPEHGEFWQTPNSHLMGNGCPECSGNVKLTKEEFIKRANKIHGEKYNYDNVVYKNANTKVCIICPEHGEFWQKPSLHLMGSGCKKCGGKKVAEKLKSNRENFIKIAREIHGQKYDYSKVEYANERTKVCIICPEHGEFWQTPHCHLTGQGCPICGYEKISRKKTKKNEDWVEEVKKIHNNKYSYEKTIYERWNKKVIITCPIHGDFEQLAYNHQQGKGCPKCKRSHLEIEMEDFLKAKKVNFICQYRPKFLSVGKRHLSVDFYLPDYKAAIECQGKQHFIGNTFYSKNIEKIIERDKYKKDLLEQNNVRVFYYTNENNVENYFGNIFDSKEKLFKTILNNEGLL